MDASLARNIAHAGQVGRRDRFGEPLIEHVERVAAAVPEDAARSGSCTTSSSTPT
jgi:hypothetical protein